MNVSFPYALEYALDDLKDRMEDVRDYIEYQRRSIEGYEQDVEERAAQMIPKEACNFRERAERIIKARKRDLKHVKGLLTAAMAFKEASTGAVMEANRKVEHWKQMQQIEAHFTAGASHQPKSKDWWLAHLRECTAGSDYNRTEYLLDFPEAQIAIYGHIRLHTADCEPLTNTKP